MKVLYITIILFFNFNCLAMNTWPNGAAPCNGILQLCIDNSPEGEYIEIHTNGPINENIFSNNFVSVVAATGYKPIFSAGNNLILFGSVNSTNSNLTITIKGLTFEQGSIAIDNRGEQNTFHILNNTILSTVFTKPGISFVGNSSFDSVIAINYNQIIVEYFGGGDPLRGISARNGFLNSGTLSGLIFGNTITAKGSKSIGISIKNNSANEINLDITGNEVYGAVTGGLYAYNDHALGNMNLNISNNAFLKHDDIYLPSGIHIINNLGTATANIINNSVIGSNWGLLLQENSGSLSVIAYNNIIAYANNGFSVGVGVTLDNDYNLTYQNSTNDNYSSGSNTIMANPMIKSLTNAHLKNNSPAIGAANNFAFLLTPNAPFMDADGTARFKIGGNPTTNIDIGAYEYGDVYFNHQNQSSSTNISQLSHPNLNGNAQLDYLHHTSNYNPSGSNTNVFNNDNESLYYNAGFWNIFNMNLSNIMPQASFNLFGYATVNQTFAHVVSTGDSSNVELNNGGLNGHSDYILQVSQIYNGSVTNPHPFGILFFDSNWIIYNIDSANFPIGTSFNIYYQKPSKSAWVHKASSANIIGSSTVLDNPIINGVDCAQIQVTQGFAPSATNNSPIGVKYINSSWRIFNQNLSAIPNNASFHVTVSPEQVSDCKDVIFLNGFD